MTMTAVKVKKFDHRKIGDLRRARGWTQVQLADESGIHIDSIREYERGRSYPSVPRLLILVEALGCQVEDLTTVA
jgi:transcriptional regulator with XRE-family HTH domain